MRLSWADRITAGLTAGLAASVVHNCCRLTAQQLADLCVARQLYSSTVMKIKQQRQLLVLQLQQLLDRFTGMQHYRTDAIFTSLAGGLLSASLCVSAAAAAVEAEWR